MRSTHLRAGMGLHFALAQVPRAVQSSVLANIPRAVRAGQGAGDRPPQNAAEAVEHVRAMLEVQASNFQGALDDINARIATGTLGSPNAGERIEDPEYSKQFDAWARRGEGFGDLVSANRTGDRQRINAAMSIAPGESGGVLAPSEWDREIRKAQRERSPFRQIANVVLTSVNAYTTVWNTGGFGTAWVGETVGRPATSTPSLATLEFGHGEIMAFPFVTQRLIDDADFPLEKWLADEIADEFDRQEGIAFVAGDGANKPFGFLTYATGGVNALKHPGGAIVTAPTGAAAALGGPDTLVDFVYSLPAAYRQGAHWLMNSSTAATIAKMKDGQGNYLWRETYVAGQPPTLLGFPASIDENMPAIAAGSLPIAFGDFKRGYVINDRFGVRVLRDPFTNKPYVGFYTTKRVGGGVLDPRAIRVMKVAAA